MTLNEYAIKLGLNLNSAQIQVLDLIDEKKDESLIISFPRLSGRQLIYNLVERKKGYDEGYQQGRADAFREIEKAMYHQCFECDNDENMQKWDGGNWFRYKLFENVIEKLKERK